MVIEEEDFILTPCQGLRWDLELLQTVKPKGKPERKEFQVEGYGMSLDSCMKKIINHRVAEKKEVYSLKEYFEEYKKELNKLECLLKNM
ncbi:hypothetical protein [Intestinibacter sp.]|uniref:hypothetical protein n=1 Tax=Intestinibacter sp. TaxID=1965304 RepID=UPI002A7537A9|nr:hypothetical protein [Intestinibacter sp.]MDY2736698.1 hypothetical protein [Intestinibacter sp.]